MGAIDVTVYVLSSFKILIVLVMAIFYVLQVMNLALPYQYFLCIVSWLAVPTSILPIIGEAKKLTKVILAYVICEGIIFSGTIAAMVVILATIASGIRFYLALIDVVSFVLLPMVNGAAMTLSFRAFRRIRKARAGNMDDTDSYNKAMYGVMSVSLVGSLFFGISIWFVPGANIISGIWITIPMVVAISANICGMVGVSKDQNGSGLLLAHFIMHALCAFTVFTYMIFGLVGASQAEGGVIMVLPGILSIVYFHLSGSNMVFAWVSRALMLCGSDSAHYPLNSEMTY
jgi:hypothetical protein